MFLERVEASPEVVKDFGVAGRKSAMGEKSTTINIITLKNRYIYKRKNSREKTFFLDTLRVRAREKITGLHGDKKDQR